MPRFMIRTSTLPRVAARNPAWMTGSTHLPDEVVPIAWMMTVYLVPDVRSLGRGQPSGESSHASPSSASHDR